jgi:hypothetical protein
MLDEMFAYQRAKCLLKGLAASNRAPKNIQLTTVAGGYFASVFDEAEINCPISERVAIGFSKSSSVAVLKGLVEWVERMAFRQAAANGVVSCQTKRSDGMAAFPLALIQKAVAQENARANAYNEAVERYVWATWWDQDDIDYEQHSPNAVFPDNSLCGNLLSEVEQLIPIDRFQVVLPQIANPPYQYAVVILMAHLKNGGTLTGGAAGRYNDPNVWERAASELFRHSLAYSRMIASSRGASTFYQKRLLFFASGAGRKIVQQRLSTSGRQKVHLPDLLFDEEISYSDSHLVYAHRCFFPGQPLFMAGSLNRLCI